MLFAINDTPHKKGYFARFWRLPNPKPDDHATHDHSARSETSNEGLGDARLHRWTMVNFAANFQLEFMTTEETYCLEIQLCYTNSITFRVQPRLLSRTTSFCNLIAAFANSTTRLSANPNSNSMMP